MAESRPEVVEGALDSSAILVDAVVSGDIPQWAPVVLVAPGSGEDLPRVGTTTTAGDKNVYGVKVAPKKTLVAGDIAQICVFGRCKVKVDGAASTIARGTALQTHAEAGVAEGQAALDAPTGGATQYYDATIESALQAEFDKIRAAFAIALESASADGDIIACDVRVLAVK